MSTPGQPVVSVVIPTYQRPGLLRRAIASVLAQTYGDWELIVSDDQRGPNASREYAEAAARVDARVRVVENPGERGQAGNLNHAMRLSRGAWIKPLCDDDTLMPGCLAGLLAAAERHPGAALVQCLAEFHRPGGAVQREALGRRAPVEAVGGPDALLAMYVQDVEIGAPSQVLARRDAVEAGAWFPADPRIVCGADQHWYTLLLQRGDLLLVNQTLAAHYQSGHDTITSRTTREQSESELGVLRALIADQLRGTPRMPSLHAVHQAARIRCGLWLLRQGKPVSAAKTLVKCWSPAGWRMGVRWLLRKRMPGRFQMIRRSAVTAGEAPTGAAPARG